MAQIMMGFRRPAVLHRGQNQCPALAARERQRTDQRTRSRDRWRFSAARFLLLACVPLMAGWLDAAGRAAAQERNRLNTAPRAESRQGSERLGLSDDPTEPSFAAEDAGDDAELSRDAVVEQPQARGLDMVALVMSGGWLMLLLTVMSVAVVAIGFDRLLALRRGRVLPAGLVEGLTELSGVPGVMDPRRAYRLCQEFPSPAAVVIRSMLLKIGRPQSEVEHAVAEASNREAERLFGTARWLTLIAAVAPLIGLLGTVWGMIRAFYDTTQMAAGHNKADFLAQGIYVALVTTLGGLVVAIPAAVLAHYFEGRVVKWFHEIDELLFSLLPQVERFEGRMRVTPHTLGGSDESLDGDSRLAAAPTRGDGLRSGESPRSGERMRNADMGHGNDGARAIDPRETAEGPAAGEPTRRVVKRRLRRDE